MSEKEMCPVEDESRIAGYLKKSHTSKSMKKIMVAEKPTWYAPVKV